MENKIQLIEEIIDDIAEVISNGCTIEEFNIVRNNINSKKDNISIKTQMNLYTILLYAERLKIGYDCL